MLNRHQYDDVDYGRIEPFRKRQVQLDAAVSQENPVEVDLAGTFLYLDDDTTGKVYIRFNSEDAARIPVSAGFSVSGIVYKRIYLDWDAQPGDVVNFVYGSGVEFTPTNDISNLGSVGQVDKLQGNKQTSLYNASLLVNGAITTILTPAANVNGVWVYKVVAQDTVVAFDTSAPASIYDSPVIANQQWDGTYQSAIDCQVGSGPVWVPAGNGIYCMMGSVNPRNVTVYYEVL